MNHHICRVVVVTVAAIGLPILVWADDERPVLFRLAQADDNPAVVDAKSSVDRTADSKSANANLKADKTADAKSDSKDKSAPSTYTVKQGPFKVDLVLDGLFESKRNSEITIHPESWSGWTVATAVEQGANVKQGDVLIEFDTTKIDEQIRELLAERKLGQLSLDQLASEIRLLEQSMPLDL